MAVCLFAATDTSYRNNKSRLCRKQYHIWHRITNRDADSYPAQLQKLLGKKYSVGNFGKPGATLLAHGHRPYMQQEEYQKALDFSGDIVVIHLGINDTDPRNWPNYRDEFVHDYLKLIESFKKVNPQCRILLAYITPIADRHPRFISGTQQWHEEIQEAIKVVAQISQAELIDFHTPLYLTLFYCLMPFILMKKEHIFWLRQHTQLSLAIMEGLNYRFSILIIWYYNVIPHYVFMAQLIRKLLSQ